MDLKASTLSGLSWSASGRVVRELVQLATMLVLARLLTPEDFGSYAIVMLFINLISILGSAGSSQILILKRDAGSEVTDALFFLNLTVGAVVYLLLLVLSGAIANFFSAKDIEPLLDIAGLALLMQAPVLVQRALMERDMKFEALIKTEMAAVLTAACIGIGCAIAGMGVYSLVVYNLSATAITALTLGFLCNWRPSGRPGLSALSDTLPMVFQFTGFAFLNFLTRNADTFLVGRVIGSGSLGLYSMAYRLTLYPVQALSQVVHRVAYPMLSRLEAMPSRARHFYLRSLQGITLLSFPALIGLSVVAESLVPVVLGEQWAAMTRVVELLAWVGLLQVITATVGTIYPAFGETRMMLMLALLNTLVVIGSFLVGVTFGIEGVAAAYLIANIIMFLVQARMAWPLLELPMRDGLAAIYPSLAASLLMGILVAGVAEATANYGVSRATTLLLQLSAGVITYPAILWLLFREHLLEMREALRRS